MKLIMTMTALVLVTLAAGEAYSAPMNGRHLNGTTINEETGPPVARRHDAPMNGRHLNGTAIKK